MISLQHKSLNYNTSTTFNFDGGNLSSDSGLIAFRSFDETIGLSQLIKDTFKEDSTKRHTTASIIQQLIYTTIAGYHKDDDSDQLRDDPVFTSIVGKAALASQPTVSRCLNSFSEADIEKFNEILRALFEKVYDPTATKYIILDIDSTHVQTHGKQENSAFNYHYSSNGFHPLVLYNGFNGDLLKIELRRGSVYTSNNAKAFLEPILKWLQDKYPNTDILIRADSGFATPALYELADEYGAHFVIRLKANATLKKLSEDIMSDFQNLYGEDYTKEHIMYDTFHYQASSWEVSRRVVCKLERAAGELLPRVTFIVTSLEAEPKHVLKVYNKRGNMENFIKETKLDFGMDTLSHSSFLANSIKCLIKVLAYNLVNIMKRTVMPKEFIKSRMLTIRSFLVKIACRHIKSGRKTTFKMSSSYPYKKIFLSVMRCITEITFG